MNKKGDNMPNQITFTLTFYETQFLLNELEFLMRVANRNRDNDINLYEKIATAFYGQPIKIEK
jgi:hypothetical protein